MMDLDKFNIHSIAINFEFFSKRTRFDFYFVLFDLICFILFYFTLSNTLDVHNTILLNVVQWKCVTDLLFKYVCTLIESRQIKWLNETQEKSKAKKSTKSSSSVETRIPVNLMHFKKIFHIALLDLRQRIRVYHLLQTNLCYSVF